MKSKKEQLIEIMEDFDKQLLVSEINVRAIGRQLLTANGKLNAEMSQAKAIEQQKIKQIKAVIAVTADEILEADKKEKK